MPAKQIFCHLIWENSALQSPSLVKRRGSKGDEFNMIVETISSNYFIISYISHSEGILLFQKVKQILYYILFTKILTE